MSASRSRANINPNIPPAAIPRRKALPISSVIISLYSLSESTYTVYTRVKGLSRLFCKIIEECEDKLPKGCEL